MSGHTKGSAGNSVLDFLTPELQEINSSLGKPHRAERTPSLSVLLGDGGGVSHRTLEDTEILDAHIPFTNSEGFVYALCTSSWISAPLRGFFPNTM